MKGLSMKTKRLEPDLFHQNLKGRVGRNAKLTRVRRKATREGKRVSVDSANLRVKKVHRWEGDRDRKRNESRNSNDRKEGQETSRAERPTYNEERTKTERSQTAKGGTKKKAKLERQKTVDQDVSPSRNRARGIGGNGTGPTVRQNVEITQHAMGEKTS